MKIFFCTTAPSKNYRSWSNIPYLLQKNLEKRGYKVNNYVMREIEPLKTIFNIPIRLANRIFKSNNTYFYVRTPLHYLTAYLYSRWIGFISEKDDVMLVQGFSYPLNNKKNKQIVIGDWPSEYLFEKFLKRKPNRFEEASIRRENYVIESADAVITLFPNVREYMLQKYKNKNIHCFGNAVNVDDSVLLPLDVRKKKINSKRIIFVGQSFYVSGAYELIEAARILRENGVECEVDIIGMDYDIIKIKYAWLNVHGYLDKENKEEKKKYYELLANARVFVNTTPGWSGFQALLEAMYFYCPVVVRTNESIVSYFPNVSEFGLILEEGGPNLESILLECLCDDEKYLHMSEASRRSVESSTWSNLTDNIIRIFS